MLSFKVAMELIEGPGFSPAEKVPALRLNPCYSSIDTASPLSARLILQYRIDRLLLSSDTPTAAQNLIDSLFLSELMPYKHWQTRGQGQTNLRSQATTHAHGSSVPQASRRISPRTPSARRRRSIGGRSTRALLLRATR